MPFLSSNCYRRRGPGRRASGALFDVPKYSLNWFRERGFWISRSDSNLAPGLKRDAGTVYRTARPDRE